MKLCVIPARGGSKRIPQKNTKLFNNKPIIGYSIDAAFKSNCFDKVIVSTDDEEIARVAEEMGAEIPFLRPDELANDQATTLPVIRHTIDWFHQNGMELEYVCCIYATAPFIEAKFIQEALSQLQQTDAEYCFAATQFSFPIQRAFKLTHKGRVEMFNLDYFNTRSQDLEEAYHDAGQFCWGKASAFLAEKMTFSEFSIPYLLPQYRVQDIDTEEDWLRAELMYKVMHGDE
ncbi:MAG: pseudaminic acid cytidylyltransferase [Methylococcales bacterium]|nr:pseudaminic acid cytidylyltransferase [Methylococcales bacterium]